MESISLHLENFDGPFDLLLQLVKVNKMEITEIKISEITAQYMAVLKAMDELDLDIASEFFVMAAALIEIKSRELLPKKPQEEPEVPTRELLLHRLKEYEFFREKAVELSDHFRLNEVIVTRRPITLPEEKQVEIKVPEGFGWEEFFLLFMELLDRQQEKKNIATVIERRIPADAFKVEDKIRELQEELKIHRKIVFSSLAARSSGKAETIVFFLAVLEMMRNLEVNASQSDTGELIIEERTKEHELRSAERTE